MATGIQGTGVVRGIRRIVILEDSAVEAENEVEVSYQLSKDERALLAGAAQVALTFVVTETGTAAFAVESIVESIGNTNFRTVENFTDLTIDATGEFRINLSQPILAEYVKVLIGTVTLSSGNSFDIVIALELRMDPAKHGG